MSLLKSALGRAKLRINQFRRRNLLREVKDARDASASVPYRDEVRVSLVLQFFNKRANIPELVRTMRETSADEVIVCDDGSVDASMQEWMRLLTRPNDFILRANDIFEVRTYDRCVRMARGRYVVLLQDDDIAVEPGGAWLENALSILDRDPAIAILGGRAGLDLKVEADAAFDMLESARPMNQHGYRYVAAVNRAPWILRSDAYHALGGIDQGFAPFQHDDTDICLRAWLNGLRVAHYHAGFVRDVGTGGMRLFNERPAEYQADWKWRKAVENWKTLQLRYGRSASRVQALVDAAAAPPRPS